MKNIINGRFIAILLVCGVATQCTSRQTILTLGAISMKKASIEKKGKEIGKITAQYCKGDASLSDNPDDTNLGMIDEAVLQAEKKSQATYLTNVKVIGVSDAGTYCVEIQGLAWQ